MDPTFGVAVTSSVFPPSNDYAVVVGIDFDVTGDHAFAEALRLAEDRTNTVVHAVYVLSANLGSRRQAVIEKRNEALENVPELLRTHVTNRFGTLANALGERLVLHVRVGTPAEAIHQLAIDVDAELIIVGTHGRTGLRKLALGSVAQTLAQNAHCPVLVARPKDYSGDEKTAKPLPLCDDCATARTESNGEKLWCDWHARPHIRAHVYGYQEFFAAGRDPGITGG
ncbi:MAG: universal stress protein [Deltaproteobacteria bacterium]|nr:universal stress protein [Deltaproteobacteria bacterium]